MRDFWHVKNRAGRPLPALTAPSHLPNTERTPTAARGRDAAGAGGRRYRGIPIAPRGPSSLGEGRRTASEVEDACRIRGDDGRATVGRHTTVERSSDRQPHIYARGRYQPCLRHDRNEGLAAERAHALLPAGGRFDPETFLPQTLHRLRPLKCGSGHGAAVDDERRFRQARDGSPLQGAFRDGTPPLLLLPHVLGAGQGNPPQSLYIPRRPDLSEERSARQQQAGCDYCARDLTGAGCAHRAPGALADP